METPTSEEEYRRILDELPEDQRESFERMMGTFKPWEKLHPDLAAFVVDDGPFTSIKHPLVFDIMYVPGIRDGMLNDMLAAKREALREYEKEGNWRGWVWMHERPYRLEALVRIQHNITDDCAFWDLVGGIWTDSENIWQNYPEWENLLTSDRPCRESMMEAEEQEFLAGLPEEITIYRGYNGSKRYKGFSWTLERERAEWFAKRFASHRGPAYLATGKVKRDDVLAYFDGRGEKEIVALPQHVEILNCKMVG